MLTSSLVQTRQLFYRIFYLQLCWCIRAEANHLVTGIFCIKRGLKFIVDRQQENFPSRADLSLNQGWPCAIFLKEAPCFTLPSWEERFSFILTWTEWSHATGQGASHIQAHPDLQLDSIQKCFMFSLDNSLNHLTCCCWIKTAEASSVMR